MSSVKAILEFVSGERGPVSAHLVACELERFGRLSSDWPKATVEQWREAIEVLILMGQLQSDGKGNVYSETERFVESRVKNDCQC